jgi:hypothetical protein
MGAPAMQVAENAGVEGAVILAKIQNVCEEKGVSVEKMSCCSFCY